MADNGQKVGGSGYQENRRGAWSGCLTRGGWLVELMFVFLKVPEKGRASFDIRDQPDDDLCI